jgi:hypothetical protein
MTLFAYWSREGMQRLPNYDAGSIPASVLFLYFYYGANMISDSLSFGMRDALDQGVANDTTFVSQCRFSTAEDLEAIITMYEQVYWIKHPEAGDATRKALQEGRIILPRNMGCCSPIGQSGQSLYADFDQWKAAVAEHAPDWSMGWCHHTFRDRITKEDVLSTHSILELVQLFRRPVLETV